MDARSYRRRATGEMAIDPALYELVINTGALLDRLICAFPSPIPVEKAARLAQGSAAAGGGGETGGGGGKTGGAGGGSGAGRDG